ncbi:hypothetical protein MRX96_003690 [Rhipicephalus microplus]
MKSAGTASFCRAPRAANEPRLTLAARGVGLDTPRSARRAPACRTASVGRSQAAPAVAPSTPAPGGKELDVTATELVDRQDASDAARSRLVQLCREFKKTAPHYTEPPCGAHPSLVVWKEEAHDPTKEDPPKACGAGKAIESSLAFLQPLSTALYTEEICVINLSDVIVFRETQGRGLSGTRAGY